MELSDLIKDHGSIVNIPQTALEDIGFKRILDKTQDSPVYKLIPIHSEQKEKEDLFDTLSFSGNQTHRISLNYASADRALKTLNSITNHWEFGDVDQFLERYCPQDSPIHLFMKKVQNRFVPTLKYETERHIISSLFEGHIFCYASPEHTLGDFRVEEVSGVRELRFPLISEIGDLLYDYLHNEEDYELDDIEDEFENEENPGKKLSDNLLRQLEHLISKVSDTNYFEENYSSFHEKPGSAYANITDLKMDGITFSEELPEDIHHLFYDPSSPQSHLITHYTNAFLSMIGLTPEIEKPMTLKEYSIFLDSIKSDSFSTFSEMKKLQNQIKTASFKERKELSAQYKIVKQEHKINKQILEGAKEFISPYISVSKKLKNITREVKRTLSFTNTNNEVYFTLDGKIDPEKDFDPGEISGDCTEGRPLPFYRPDTFNIKVYSQKNKDEQSRHTGNIYLLETVTTEPGKEPVWHLDAIQINEPVDWKTALPNLFSVLGEEAEKNNIEYITINSEQALISNYQAVSHAAINLYRESQLIQLTIPKHNSKERSEFQSNGTGYVVWSKE